MQTTILFSKFPSTAYKEGTNNYFCTNLLHYGQMNQFILVLHNLHEIQYFYLPSSLSHCSPAPNFTHNSKPISSTSHTHHNHPFPWLDWPPDLVRRSSFILIHHHNIDVTSSIHSPSSLISFILPTKCVGVNHSIRTVVLWRSINHLRLISCTVVLF